MTPDPSSAVAFLRKALSHGPRQARDIFVQSCQLGYDYVQLIEARRQLGVTIETKDLLRIVPNREVKTIPTVYWTLKEEQTT